MTNHVTKTGRWREPLSPRERLLRKQHRRCAICKLPNSRVRAHRLIPLFKNGCQTDWSDKNVILLCPQCHRQASKVIQRQGTLWAKELFEGA